MKPYKLLAGVLAALAVLFMAAFGFLCMVEMWDAASTTLLLAAVTFLTALMLRADIREE